MHSGARSIRLDGGVWNAQISVQIRGSRLENLKVFSLSVAEEDGIIAHVVTVCLAGSNPVGHPT